jgi:thiamine-phosphate pyrophosphorylase
VRLPPLYAIVDVEVAERFGMSPLAAVRACLAGGARCLQVRAKRLASGEFLTLTREVMAAAAWSEALVIVNDRVDIAKIGGAHGVHLGQEDLAPSAARQMLGGGAIIGISTHTRGQFRAASAEPVDYVAVGPVFGTRTKHTGYSAVGLELVREATRLALPIVAIGGITLTNGRSVLDAGAASVAIISDLFTGGGPEDRVRELVAALGQGPKQPEHRDL